MSQTSSRAATRTMSASPTRRSPRLKTLVLAAMMSAIAAGYGAAPAAAQAPLGGNNQRFQIIVNGGFPGRVIASGPITGVGQDISESDADVSWVFPRGTLQVRLTTVSSTDTFNASACIDRFEGVDTWDILDGTGEYSQATGSGTATFRGIFVGQRTADGCTDDGKLYYTVSAVGHISLSTTS